MRLPGHPLSRPKAGFVARKVLGVGRENTFFGERGTARRLAVVFEDCRPLGSGQGGGGETSRVTRGPIFSTLRRGIPLFWFVGIPGECWHCTRGRTPSGGETRGGAC